MSRLFGTDGVRGVANGELTPEFGIDGVFLCHVRPGSGFVLAL